MASGPSGGDWMEKPDASVGSLLAGAGAAPPSEFRDDDACRVESKLSDEDGWMDETVYKAIKTDFTGIDRIAGDEALPPKHVSGRHTPPLNAVRRINDAEELELELDTTMYLLAPTSSSVPPEVRRRSFSETVDPAQFPEPSSFPVEVRDASLSYDALDRASETEDDARDIRPVPPLKTSGPEFLRWSHYHVFAPSKALYPALRAALSAHADVQFDASHWKFVCTVCTHQPEPLMVPAKSQPLSRSSSSLRHSRSSSELLSAPRFIVNVHMADAINDHHVVEFSSGKRMSPRLYQTVFNTSMTLLRTADGITRVLCLPERRPTPAPAVTKLVAAHLAGESSAGSTHSVDDMPQPPTHDPVLPPAAVAHPPSARVPMMG